MVGVGLADSGFEIPLEEKRLINEKKYRDSVSENQALNQHLEYGLFTRNTSLIQNISTQLWEDKSIYTEDPIYDYIVKARDWVFHEIEYPYFTYPALLWKQIDAQTTLTTRVREYHTKPKGYCDEKDIVFKSFMLQKDIPTQIRVLEKTDEFGNIYRHSAVLVWWNNSWIKVDPSKYAKVGHWGAGWEKEGVEDITEKAPLDAAYMISAEKW